MSEVEGYKHPQGSRGKFDHPLLIVALPFVFGAREIHGDAAIEFESHGLRTFDRAREIGGDLIGPWAAVARKGAELVGADANRHLIALEVAGKIGAIQLEFADAAPGWCCGRDRAREFRRRAN